MSRSRMARRMGAIGVLLLGIAAPARAQDITIKLQSADPDATMGLVDAHRVVAYDLTLESSESSGEPFTCQQLSPANPPLVQFRPETFSLTVNEVRRIWVVMEPEAAGGSESTEVGFHCFDTGSPGLAGTASLLVNTANWDALQVNLEPLEGQIRATDTWWPIRLDRSRAPLNLQAPEVEVEFWLLEGDARFYNTRRTRLGEGLSTANLIEVKGGGGTSPVTVLARLWLAEPHDIRAGDTTLFIDFVQTFEVIEGSVTVNPPGLSLDLGMRTSTEEGDDLPIPVKHGAAGRLTARLRDAGERSTVQGSNYFWVGNWDRAQVDYLGPDDDDNDHSQTEARLHFPESESAAPPDGRLAFVVWGQPSGDGAGNRATWTEATLELSDDLPSVYGCASAAGRSTALAADLLLLLLFGGLARRRRAGMLLLLLGVLGVTPAARAQEAPAPKKLGLAFTGVVAPPNANPAEVKAISEYLQTELIARGYYQVVGPGEIQALMGLETQKQLLGCSDSSAACLAEVGGALGSDRLLSGNVTRVGSSVILSISLLDVQSARLIHRAGERVKVDESLEPLLDVVPGILDEVIARDGEARARLAQISAAAGAPTGTSAPTDPGAPTGTGPAETAPPPEPTVVTTAGSRPTAPGRGGPIGPAATLAPPPPDAAGPDPFADAHQGAGTFLLSLQQELGFPTLGGVTSLGLRWRRGLLGVSLGGLIRPGEAVARPERPGGLRATFRLYPRDFGRVAPFLGLGATGLVPTWLLRSEGGVEIGVGDLRVTVTAGLEFLLTDRAFFNGANPLLGLGVGYAF